MKTTSFTRSGNDAETRERDADLQDNIQRVGDGLDLKCDLGRAFRRNFSAFSFLILASLILMTLSTAYFALAFNREQFKSLSDVQEYDNILSDVTTMDDWSRTKFYWSNNLGIVGLYAATFPTYLGANSVLLTSYHIGLAIVYNYHAYGPNAMLVFAGVIFVHGMLELTGIFIIGAASLILAWKFWSYLGRVLKSGFGRMTRKRKAAAKRYLTDYALMVALGSFMVFLAAPIEAYFSPYAGLIFFLWPPIALFFLGAVVLFYASIISKGFTPMRRTVASVLGDAKAVFSGKWRPTYLSLLMLAIFSLMIWLGLFL
ncbi:MAG: stage II sporulation protein M [Methanobacteriota archaeon]